MDLLKRVAEYYRDHQGDLQQQSDGLMQRVRGAHAPLAGG